jgi:hypothetical protein
LPGSPAWRKSNGRIELVADVQIGAGLLADIFGEEAT